MKIVFERRTAMQFEFVSFDSSCDESSKPKSGNLWHHVVNISLEPFRNIFRKIWGNYTAMQFEFDSFMSCCDDSSNPKSLITAWFSLLFFCRSSLHSDLKLRIPFKNCSFKSCLDFMFDMWFSIDFLCCLKMLKFCKVSWNPKNSNS